MVQQTELLLVTHKFINVVLRGLIWLVQSELRPHSFVKVDTQNCHHDVIKWKPFPLYWPVAREIHRSPVDSPHKGQWRGALTLSLICAWTNGWVNNCEASDFRRHRAHHDVTAMVFVWDHFSTFHICGVHVKLHFEMCSSKDGMYQHRDYTEKFCSAVGHISIS